MPDDPLLYVEDIAKRLGVHPGTWRGYVGRGQAPPPDPADREVTDTHVRPRWRRSVIDAWVASRPGRGVRTNSRKDGTE
jgi:hypothetical protein